eukprot:Sspe_Gene.220::Locus_76_Transcript_55_57_Confidence_0.027_Length_879::g.220::m.220
MTFEAILSPLLLAAIPLSPSTDCRWLVHRTSPSLRTLHIYLGCVGNHPLCGKDVNVPCTSFSSITMQSTLRVPTLVGDSLTPIHQPSAFPFLPPFPSDCPWLPPTAFQVPTDSVAAKKKKKKKK